MKFYKEKYFNRRNWLLDNLYKLKLSNDECMLIMQIDYFNEFDEAITIDSLSEKLNLNHQQVDNAIQQLVSKGYVKIVAKQMRACFDIDGVFEAANNVIVNSNVFDLIETELGKVLTRKDVNTINEWLRIYDYDTIVEALRSALVVKKKSIAYIDKILANGSKDE